MYPLITQLSTDFKTSVTNLFTAAELLKPTYSTRSALGVVLQNPAVRPWSRSIVWATVMDILPAWSGWNGECDAIVKRYLDLQRHIQESGLDKDIDQPPLINVSTLPGSRRIAHVAGPRTADTSRDSSFTSIQCDSQSCQRVAARPPRCHQGRLRELAQRTMGGNRKGRMGKPSSKSR